MILIDTTYNNTADEIIQRLTCLYPDAKSELNFSSEYELLIAVVLSAQCTDKKVNEVTREFFNLYRSFNELARAKIEQIETVLRTINYYKTKSRHLIALANDICTNHNCEVPKDFKNLVLLPGVGQKTANVILSELGITFTLPVDTHVFRVSKRLGMSTGKTPAKVEEELKKIIAPPTWRFAHHSLIVHGRRVCSAIKPKCNACTLRDICFFYNHKQQS